MQLKTEMFKSHKTELKIVAIFTKSEQIIRVRIAPFEYSDTSANEDNSFRNHIR
jgi:hypothetical protein